MNWKYILYDWGGLNIFLFQAINTGTPTSLAPLAYFFSLAGSYWTAPLTMLGLWGWSRSSADKYRVSAIRRQFFRFCVAFGLALLFASILKYLLDFPRPPAVLGDLVQIMGEVERHYSLPSGHSTYAALVAGALWSLVNTRFRIVLALYVGLVGWSRIAAGLHFPADVLAGWTLGFGCIVIAEWLMRLNGDMRKLN